MISFRRQRKKRLLAEINLIPFTDVVLVILVIFMVTTPLLVQSSIKVELPKSSLDSPSQSIKPIDITITNDGSIWINNLRAPDLKSVQQQLVYLKVEQATVSIKGDKSVNYGVVASVLGLVQKLGAKAIELEVQFKKD